MSVFRSDTAGNTDSTRRRVGRGDSCGVQIEGIDHVENGVRKLDPYKNALKEISKKNPDIDKVLSLLERSIEEGNGEAAYALGTWYLHGHYVAKNLRKATTLIRKAANDNVSDALYDMAVSYESGIGVKKSEGRAVEYYLRAALHGDKQSFFELGRCYYHGLGIERNRKLAKVWYDRAEELGVHD